MKKQVVPGSKRVWRTAVAVAVAVLAAGVAATDDFQDADAIKIRQANFKEIGAAFKSLRDEIRARSPDPNAIGSSSRDLARRAKVVSTLFPSGSGPETGVKTRAKAEIWRDEARFKASMEEFITASTELFMAVRANDRNAMEAGYKLLGDTCKACHDSYRVPD